MSLSDRDLLARAFELALSPTCYSWFERLADVQVPGPLRAPLYQSLARLGGVDLTDVAAPLAAFPSVGAFFLRRLADGARPIDPDPSTLVSPADGMLQGFGTFAAGADPILPIKGAQVALGRALGPAYREAIAAGGHFFVVYLSPRDYHRVHLPATGCVRSWQSVPGTRFPVNALGVRACPEVLWSNERAVVELELEGADRLFLVLVAAFGVARTELAFATPEEVRRRAGGPPVALSPPRSVERGAEIGAFNLGSTVIAVWPAARDPVVWLRRAGPVRVGQAVVRFGHAGA
ncbi:MAG: phosphatidylserine decarboxylase [Deltaproteobacteria bacterium]|nr:phosphatidylserine decarboxylase [Deltaproteobacteria bacterium]